VNQYLPITNWLGHYKVKDDLVADIIAGITIAIMNIPQGKSTVKSQSLLIQQKILTYLKRKDS